MVYVLSGAVEAEGPMVTPSRRTLSRLRAVPRCMRVVLSEPPDAEEREAVEGNPWAACGEEDWRLDREDDAEPAEQGKDATRDKLWLQTGHALLFLPKVRSNAVRTRRSASSSRKQTIRPVRMLG